MKSKKIKTNDNDQRKRKRKKESLQLDQLSSCCRVPESNALAIHHLLPSMERSKRNIWRNGFFCFV